MSLLLKNKTTQQMNPKITPRVNIVGSKSHQKKKKNQIKTTTWTTQGTKGVTDGTRLTMFIHSVRPGSHHSHNMIAPRKP